MKKIIVGVILIALIIAGGFSVAATSSTMKELQEQKEAQQKKADDLANKKAEQQRRKNQQSALLKDIENQYGVIDDRLEAGDEILQDLFSRISELELEIVEMNMSIEELDLAIEEKELEINGVRLELQQIREDKDLLNQQAMERIRVMYEYGDTGYLEVLLEAEDLMDMFSRMEYINRLVEADNNLFDNLDRFEEEITARETSLVVFETSLQEIKADALKERAALEEKVLVKGLEVEQANEHIEAQKAEQEELAEAEEQTEAQIRNIQAQLNAIAAEEKRVDEEIRRIIALEAAEAARLSGLDYSGGAILWPTPGWTRISSPFGPRLHPIHKTWKNHNGIDVAAAGGTPIVAVMKGKVILSKYSSSYGNYCVIAHGNGYASLYAHCSALYVKVGDEVEANEKIAAVGTTGWSTGNHLHFGFQKNDVWVDPMPYFY